MTLTTDHVFHIGTQHLRQGVPCQDHALSGVLASGFAYGIVSDGCSSGGMTDIGARLVSVASREALTENVRETKPHRGLRAAKEESIGFLRAAQATLALQPEDMLATALVAVLSSHGRLYTYCYGDGVIAYRDDSGSLYAITYEWLENAPFYPIYRGALQERFIDHHDDQVEPRALTRELWQLTPTEELRERVVFSALDGSTGVEDGSTNFDDLPITDAAVFTDGVQQVDGMSWQEAVRQLLAFKSTEGRFAARRMNGFLKNLRQTGRGPLDDIAYAVVRRAPPATDEEETNAAEANEVRA